jgi:hypothetical protein
MITTAHTPKAKPAEYCGGAAKSHHNDPVFHLHVLHHFIKSFGLLGKLGLIDERITIHLDCCVLLLQKSKSVVVVEGHSCEL